MLISLSQNIKMVRRCGIFGAYLYSELSGAVHVNDKDNFTPHKYLVDYNKISEEQINLHLINLEIVINNIIFILYYFTFHLVDEGIQVIKRDLLEFEKNLQEKEKNVLDEIEKLFE